MAKVFIDPGRKAAYEALTASKPVEKALSSFVNLSKKDYSLAYEIAAGVVKRSLSLDHLLNQIQDKIKLKKKEKLLIKMALYQYFFMDKIPYYAICHQTILLAKKRGFKNTAFLNVLLRKFETTFFSLPEEDTAEAFSVFYSYPVLFIQKLIEQVGVKQAKQLLQRMNKVFPSFARDRKKGIFFPLKGKKEIEKISKKPNFTIQNPTYYTILHTLKKKMPSPKSLFDICAAPGGKLLLAHDFYPEAELYANDLRKTQLQENCKKYGLKAHLFHEDARELQLSKQFDLVIADVPCSNSGVLGKRAEARYRITEEQLEELYALQIQLLQKAKSFVKKGGYIWYMTCSILQEENERVLEAMEKKGLKTVTFMTIYPDEKGFDGGFGALLQKP